MHRSTSSSRPFWIFLGISGSAKEARAMVTKSAWPNCKMLSATWISLMRPTAITGICTALLMAAAFCT